jgi:transposase
LERLRLVLEYMPDEKLMQKLEKERGLGRNDYPVRGIWNAVLAGIVYQHISVESLRRELARNGQLRYMCGLDRVPTSSAFSRFLAKLLPLEKDINAIFNQLVKELSALFPDFGTNLAIDGKAIETHARPGKEEKKKSPDGRRDTDANFGKKTYRGKQKDGTLWEKIVSWFGYKLHLLVDTDYELPVAFTVTKASAPEAPEAHNLLEKTGKTHPEIIQQCEHLMADRGYDDGKLLKKTWDQYTIKPIIDIRNMWKDGEETRLVEGRENVVYSYDGIVYCYCLKTGTRREMAYGGFEKERGTLKYRCPAAHYGISCQGKDICPVAKALRIPLLEDRRVFTPVARSSYKWEELYKKRTAVERVNSRLDVSFGFENHYIRGLKKMRLRVSLAFCVMLAMAVGRVKENQEDKMRSLVKAV